MKMSTKITETVNVESRQPINIFYLTKIWNYQPFHYCVNYSNNYDAHVAHTLTLGVDSIRELKVFQKIWQLIKELICLRFNFQLSVEQWATLDN